MASISGPIANTHMPVTQPKDELMKPCCARCKTPFGHSAVAGMCCHETKESDR